jgi:hypothetical protein
VFRGIFVTLYHLTPLTVCWSNSKPAPRRRRTTTLRIVDSYNLSVSPCRGAIFLIKVAANSPAREEMMRAQEQQPLTRHYPGFPAPWSCSTHKLHLHPMCPGDLHETAFWLDFEVSHARTTQPGAEQPSVVRMSWVTGAAALCNAGANLARHVASVE